MFETHSRLLGGVVQLLLGCRTPRQHAYSILMYLQALYGHCRTLCWPCITVVATLLHAMVPCCRVYVLCRSYSSRCKACPATLQSVPRLSFRASHVPRPSRRYSWQEHSRPSQQSGAKYRELLAVNRNRSSARVTTMLCVCCVHSCQRRCADACTLRKVKLFWTCSNRTSLACVFQHLT